MSEPPSQHPPVSPGGDRPLSPWDQPQSAGPGGPPPVNPWNQPPSSTPWNVPPPVPPPLGPVYRLSGWWRRVGATVVDGIITTAIAVVITIGGAFAFDFDWEAYFDVAETNNYTPPIGTVILFICAVIISILYAPILMKMTDGATLGKKACGIRVVRETGAPIGFWWAFLRENVVKIGLFQLLFSIAIVIDCLWPLWDGENRSLHDMLVKTRVVIDEPPLIPSDALPAGPYGDFVNPVPPG